jgi:hypothetical protein
MGGFAPGGWGYVLVHACRQGKLGEREVTPDAPYPSLGAVPYAVASVAAVLPILLGIVAAGPSALAAPTPPAPAFTPPVSLPGGGAEPSIRNSFDGKTAAYVSAPAGTGSNFWYIDQITNSDGSISFKPTLRKFDDGTGGGDSDIAVANSVDPTTGCAPLVFSGLHNIDLLTNFTTSTSNNCGHSWAPPNFFAVQNVLDDRQWMTFDGTKTAFLIYHKVDTSQISVSRSQDGGATYQSMDPTGATSIIDPTTMPSVANESQIGNIVTDYSHPTGGTYPDGEPIHTLYAIFGGPADPADNAAAQTDQSYNHVDTIYVAKSTDGGSTWTDTKVFSVDPSTHRELNMLFPVVAADSAGNVYAAWADGFKVQYAFSKNQGTTWSKAYQVNPDNRGTTPDAGRADVFPWIAAGSGGRLDVVWYHGAGGDTSAHRDPGTAPTQWTVAFAQLLSANTSDAKSNPTPNLSALNQNVAGVIHTGDVCQNGLNCDVLGGDRTLLDFFEVSVDKAGRANIAYASDVTSPGSATVMYVRQNGGLSATTGKKITPDKVVPLTLNSGTSCPGPQVIDPYGDAYPSVTTGANETNVDSADIGAVRFTTPDATHLQVAMTIKNLTITPVLGTVSTLYFAYWSYNGMNYFLQASTNGPVQEYDDGTVGAGGSLNYVGSPAGQWNTGPDGTIVWTVDRADIGAPANGAVLQNTSADDHGSFTVQGSGLRYVAYIDRAPDVGSGASYMVGGAC